MRGQRGELVRMRGERLAGQLGDLPRGALREFRVRVQARADRGATNGQRAQSGQNAAQATHVRVEERDVAGEFLPERERGSVLQVGAADLHDVRKLGTLGFDGITQMLDLRQERLLRFRRRRDGHGGGERVVGRLRHVDVIVGMDGLLAAHLATGESR